MSILDAYHSGVRPSLSGKLTSISSSLSNLVTVSPYPDSARCDKGVRPSASGKYVEYFPGDINGVSLMMEAQVLIEKDSLVFVDIKAVGDYTT